MTILLEMTNFLKLTTSLAIFFCFNAEYLDSLASLILLIYIPNILTYSGGFSSFLPSLSTKKKGAKGVDIGGFSTKSPYIGGISIVKYLKIDLQFF